MKITILFTLLIGLFSEHVHASIYNCSSPLTLTGFKSILEKTRADYFPEILKEHLIVTTFRSKNYFLQAQPHKSSLLNNRENRIYEVQLNLNMLDCPPDEEALLAILVHELEHVLDYMNWSSGRIVSHGIKYSLDFNFKVNYERATDQKVLTKGLSEGLALYREWVYQWLSKKQLIKKKVIYLTPEEIRN